MSTTPLPTLGTITVLYDGFSADSPAEPTATPGLYVVPSLTRDQETGALVRNGGWTVVHASGYCVPHLHDIIDRDHAHDAAKRLTQIDWTRSIADIQAQMSTLPSRELKQMRSALLPFAASHRFLAHGDITFGGEA